MNKNDENRDLEMGNVETNEEIAREARGYRSITSMLKKTRVMLLACVATVIGVYPLQTFAAGSVVLWNKLGSPAEVNHSEIGSPLNYYDPSVDGGSGCCDVIGNIQFVPGKFGNAVTLGDGNYYSTARVHALTLRDLSTVLNPEHGTIAVWYNEMSHPVDWVNGGYRIFDGGYGLDSPVSFDRFDGILNANIRFGGSDNALQGDFAPILNEWTHIALVWDRSGIDGTGDTVRLYVNGAEIGAIQSSSWGTDFNGNHADIAGGQDFMANRFALDNLVIYSDAKTDFSDRFNENPTTSIPEPETYAMLLAGLGLLGFMARRRKESNV